MTQTAILISLNNIRSVCVILGKQNLKIFERIDTPSSIRLDLTNLTMYYRVLQLYRLHFYGQVNI